MASFGCATVTVCVASINVKHLWTVKSQLVDNRHLEIAPGVSSDVND